MRDQKKNFLQGLLQLTILVYFFRHSTRLGTDLISNLNQINTNIDYYNDLYNLPTVQHYSSLPQQQLHGELELLRLNSRINSNNNQNQNRNISESVSSEYLNSNYRIKESRQYLNDISLLNLIQKINQTNHVDSTNFSHFERNLHPDIIFIAPASFSESNNNPKEIRNLSETRLLLNSIELNWNNQLTKEVIFQNFHTQKTAQKLYIPRFFCFKDIEMDIDMQTIIQQDIDLGIKKSLNYDIELATGASCGFEKFTKEVDLSYLNYKELQQLEENQKVIETKYL
jgi:hypothetical protein